MSRNITDAVPLLQTAWEKAKNEFKNKYPGLPQPFLTHVFRSNEEQAELYAQGRTKPGRIVTNAKPGQSKHNKRPSEAFDIAFKVDNNLDWSAHLFTKFAEIIKPMGVKWGGDFRTFKDLPHFEV